jgi:DNA-binding transcriptional regulator YiaG
LGKLESTIKSEIQRLAKREIRSTFIPLRKEVRAMRTKLSNLSKGITSLNRMIKELHLEEAKPKLEATPEEVKASRLTPERIRRLRKKLGISMRELGVLTGSSLSAVVSWESGKFKPGGEKKAALVALRKVRKREVRKLLAEKVTAPGKTKMPKRRPAVRARASRNSTRAEKRTARRRKPTAMRLKKAA